VEGQAGIFPIQIAGRDQRAIRIGPADASSPE
jgi:hypothetical protein